MSDDWKDEVMAECYGPASDAMLDGKSKGHPMTNNPISDAVADIAAERNRQKTVEGWTNKHDDSHQNGEMADAAACYAASERIFKAEQVAGRCYESMVVYTDLWPWADQWWKPKDRRRDLVRAAALIVAEIERLDRGKQ